VSNGGVISINTATLEPKAHVLTVAYERAGINKSTSVNFRVVSASMPQVDVKASVARVLDRRPPVQITAINAAGGGNHPVYNFSKNLAMTDLLQPESENNELVVPATLLTVGANEIYVQMRTSDSCYSKATDMDSVTVTLSGSGFLADPDYPDQPIGIRPNPFRDILQLTGLRSEKSYTVLIYNSSGRKVFGQSFKGNAGYEINLAILSAGTYWIRLHDDTKNIFMGVKMMIKG